MIENEINYPTTLQDENQSLVVGKLSSSLTDLTKMLRNVLRAISRFGS
jgi:hypothetical protein